MPEKFDFISATDKPALLAFSTPEWLETARSALNELGYKVHTAVSFRLDRQIHRGRK